MSDSELMTLARAAKPLSFHSGEHLWQRGDEGTLACVIEGAFDVVHFDATVDTLGPGRVLGLSALWGKPHSADVRARATEKGQRPMALVWDLTGSGADTIAAMPGLFRTFLRDAIELVHHLNELQVLYRRRAGAVAHVAAHLRRLARCSVQPDEVRIGQRELGELAGYDERTIRIALAELQRQHCIEITRRSVYRVDSGALSEIINRTKRGELD